MRFNDHWRFEGQHARLSASQYHWLRYDDKKFDEVFRYRLNSDIGDRKHTVAAELIRLRIRQQRSKKTFNAYVNDAIGFRMTPEVMLFFSENCFGTADAISFDKGILRIHDLKTGTNPASMDQLRMYAALFCLEYRINPFDIEILLRIYQSDQIVPETADPALIRQYMDTIIKRSARLDELKEEIE